MINPAWLFVSATVIADVGILVSFNKLMSHIHSKVEEGKEINIESFQKEQTRFFIKVAVVEAIPILLIVVGFTPIEQLVAPINIFIPLVIIGAVFLICLVSVLSSRRNTMSFDEISHESKHIVNTYMFMGLILLSAIPQCHKLSIP
ncbi:hypothetical protein ACOI1C_18880 [Bacillus sp. DJP31]|uniref:hypothetical protein n=1 Tax=Bacillus sp. DJP31 TaxID=3409789 RepID=UPI003BB71EE8